MASLDDATLWKRVQEYKVPDLKELLKKVGIPTSEKKEVLQRRLFYATRLGLEPDPTDAEEDREVCRTYLYPVLNIASVSS